jgi:hypothetical protein
MLPQLFEGVSNLEALYWATAFGGTLFFGLRVAMMAVVGLGHGLADGGMDGLDVSHDLPAEISTDFSVETHAGLTHAHHEPSAVESAAAFKLLSINSLTSFAMTFGWMGLACYVRFGLGAVLSTLIAGVTGTSFMFLTAWLFHLLTRMTSPGATFAITNALYREATVYQAIPGGDNTGKIHVYADGLLRELEAVSEDGRPIASFERVEVVDLRPEGRLVVKPLGE